MKAALWTTEAAMVADFTAFATRAGWVCYAETGGWDLVLARPEDGFQIGIEAKLALNATVLCQVLAHDRAARAGEGPDCHAVLVPRPKTVGGLATIAGRLGIVVITGGERERYSMHGPGPSFLPDLPKLKDHIYDWRDEYWPQRCPDTRIKLPDYVPDVCGGHSAPVKLTEWKIAALKAQIILETHGSITRADFKSLRLNPSRWTQFWLRSDGNGGWVRTGAMPDFKTQHPVNYEQIKADFAKWAPLSLRQQPLLDGAAA